jgi:hypothetical protein
MMTEARSVNYSPLKSFSVLFAFGWLTFWNSWQFMDYASVSTLGKQIFHTDNNGLNWLYSASLMAVVVSSLPAIYLMESHGVTGSWSVMAIATVSNVIGCWLRWLSVVHESYVVALLSSIVLGFAGAGVIVSIVPLAEHNFPKETRTLATTIAVQMNYLGWCLSSVIVPANSNTKTELGSMLFTQAILISFSILFFSMFHRPLPSWCCNRNSGSSSESDRLVPGGEDQRDNNHHNSNNDGLAHHFKQMSTLLFNRQFMVQCLCFSMSGGISFALPAVQDELFLEVGLPQKYTKWTNLSFLATGVLTGLIIGGVFHYKNIAPDDFYSMFTIRLLFGICTLSLSGLAVLASFAADMSNNAVFGLALILMAISGGCSLGFVGIALPQAVHIARPVSEVYSASSVEWLLQIWGVVFAQWCAGSGGGGGGGSSNVTGPSPSEVTHNGGFVICAASCGVAFFLLLFFGSNTHCNGSSNQAAREVIE